MALRTFDLEEEEDLFTFHAYYRLLCVVSVCLVCCLCVVLVCCDEVRGPSTGRGRLFIGTLLSTERVTSVLCVAGVLLGLFIGTLLSTERVTSVLCVAGVLLGLKL
jgi:hypothetical protein